MVELTKDWWNDRYRRGHYLYGTRPNEHLAAQRERLKPRTTALVPADGPGRNAVWLAEPGIDQRDKGFKSGGPPTRDDLDAATLKSDFAGCEMLELLESVVELNQGKAHQGPGSVVRMVARKS